MLISSSSRFPSDHILSLEDEGLHESSGGKHVEDQTSAVANETVGLVIGALYVHVYPQKLRKIYPAQTFQCFSKKLDQIRRPDVAFISADSAGLIAAEGHIKITPDIVVEVVSPDETLYEVDEKLDDYRSAGVKLVWVVNPNSRTIRIYRPDHTVTELQESDTLVGENVLPGFSVTVRDLLPPLPTINS